MTPGNRRLLMVFLSFIWVSRIGDPINSVHHLWKFSALLLFLGDFFSAEMVNLIAFNEF